MTVQDAHVRLVTINGCSGMVSHCHEFGFSRTYSEHFDQKSRRARDQFVISPFVVTNTSLCSVQLWLFLAKKKVSDDCHIFQECWTNACLFVEVQQKPVRLVCNKSIAVMKET